MVLKMEVKIRMLRWPALGEDHHLVFKLPNAHCVFTWKKRDGRALWDLFYKGLNAIHEGDLITFWRPTS